MPPDRYRQLFEDNTAVQLIVDPRGGGIVEANQAAADYYGIGRDALSRATVDALGTEHAETLRDALEVASLVGTHLAGVPHRHVSGEARLVDIYASPIGRGDDRVVHLIVHDVTERARAEERERALHAHRVERGLTERAAREWQGTFDAIEQPIVIVASDGRVIRANTAAASLAAMTTTAMQDRPVDALTPTAVWQAAAEHATVAFEHGFAGAARVRDDARRTWELVATRFVPRGTPDARVIIVARELTALIALQDEVQRQETLSRMGELVAGVAHEVRNPLFAISSAVDALRSRLTDNADFARYAPVLSEQVKRLSLLMQDLLDYGKPVALVVRDTLIGDILNDPIQLTHGSAAQRGVRLSMRSLLPLESTVRLDRERFAQVLHNLLLNAVQHSAKGQEVELSARRVVVAGRQFLETIVADRGEGFAPNDLPHLFEPFFTRRIGGTGLGLALAHRVVHDHGGTITADNRPNGGAMVTVRLPIDSVPRSGPGDAARG